MNPPRALVDPVARPMGLEAALQCDVWGLGAPLVVAASYAAAAGAGVPNPSAPAVPAQDWDSFVNLARASGAL